MPRFSEADVQSTCLRVRGALSVLSTVALAGLVLAAQAACSSNAAPGRPREAGALLWAAVPWVAWLLLSAVGTVIVFFAMARERRVRAALFGSTLIACFLALWPPYPWGLAQAGVHLTLQITTSDALQAVRDEALASVRQRLAGEGWSYGSAEPIGDAAFALKGLDALHLSEIHDLCADALGPGWAITDYSGGRVEARLSPPATEDLLQRTMTETVRVIERRLSALGVESPLISSGPGPARIDLEMFGIADVEQARRVLLARGRLTLQLVEAQAVTREALLAGHGGLVPEGLVVLSGPGEQPGESIHFLLGAQPIVTGRDLKSSRAGVDPDNRPAVNFTLSAPGAARFGEFTARHIGRQVAIVLDDRVESAPTIQSKIGADGQITGRFTAQQADELARILRAGALPAGLQVQSEVALPPASMVGGILRACAGAAIALVAAVLVLLFHRRASTILAALMLLGAVVVTLVAMISLQHAVTPPGVAVVIVCIGVALDRVLSRPAPAGPGPSPKPAP